ncbi:RNA chaperone Hfq [Bacillus toyonensis]
MLICGIHIHGILKGYNPISLLIESSEKSQSVYKHVIATIQLETDKK